MITKNKIFFLISIFIFYEVIRHFVGALLINWSSNNQSDIDIFFRYAYVFLEAFDSFIISILIVRLSKDKIYREYINRAKLIITITLIKFSIIVIMNTINPTNLIISDEEWENRLFQNLTISVIQILIGLIIFFFIKPSTRFEKKVNGT